MLGVLSWNFYCDLKLRKFYEILIEVPLFATGNISETELIPKKFHTRQHVN
jgi:hypothetical protein